MPFGLSRKNEAELLEVVHAGTLMCLTAENRNYADALVHFPAWLARFLLSAVDRQKTMSFSLQ